MTFSVVSGVVATGLVPGRRADSIGVQVNYAQFTGDGRITATPSSFQLGLEAYYRIQITDSIAIQPDVQWIRRPDGDASIRDALLATIRVQVTF